MQTATETKAETVKTPTMIEYIVALLTLAYKLGSDKRFRAFILLGKLHQHEAPEMDPDIWLAEERAKVQASLNFLDTAPKHFQYSPKLLEKVVGERISFPVNRTTHFLIENTGGSGRLISRSKTFFSAREVKADNHKGKIQAIVQQLDDKLTQGD